MNIQDVQQCWKQVFPNSSSSCNVILGSAGFRFFIAKDRSEVPGGIMDNDPLLYVAFLRGDNFEETALSLLVKPTVPNMVYSSVKLRKKTIKNVDPSKLVKRFLQVREFLTENSANLKNPMFSFEDK